MSELLRVLGIGVDAVRVERAGPDAVARRQQERLAALVRHARAASPYHRRLYRGLPSDVSDPRLLPPVTKRELMAHFDDWVTDPDVTLEGLRRDFLTDLSQVGSKYLGRYHVFTTSGTTGEPAVLLQDAQSWAVLNVVSRLRGRRSLVTRQDVRRALRQGIRVAALFATGGHFGGVVLAEAARRRAPVLARRIRVFSVLRPLPDLVAELNAFQPTVLSGYPSAVALLAAEEQAGRLRISPFRVLTAGETVTPAMREQIETGFGCRMVEGYAASEVPALALQCGLGSFHVNSDWYLLEPVDEQHRPVPAGETSSTVLATNLANYVQPVIRYDLGDRVRVDPSPCPCGSPFPVVQVEGRTDDVLSFAAPGGGSVSVLPLALGTVVEETPGVRRFQAMRTGERELTVRLETEPGAEPAQVRGAVDGRLGDFLRAHGTAPVTVVHAPEPPHPDPVSGKYRQVWSV